jgi:hypothetical protein
MKARPKSVIGWREWVGMPLLETPAVKAKIDTGARTSALHAFDIKMIEVNGVPMVRFKIHPFQRSKGGEVVVEAPLIDRREVKSSTGHLAIRPVIFTPIELMGQRWNIELTLTNRDDMGFRMLLGRQAIRGRFAVDPGRSYLAGRGPVGHRVVKQKGTG